MIIGLCGQVIVVDEPERKFWEILGGNGFYSDL